MAHGTRDPKKIDGLLGQRIETVTKYKFIDSQKANFPIHTLLTVLDINKSSYYYWNDTGRDSHKKRADNEAELVEKILSVHEDSKGSYGAPRMTVELADRGVQATKRHCAEVMSKHGIQGNCGRVKGPRTTTSGKAARFYPDLLNQCFTAPKPNQVWYGDITYIRVGDDFCYLATVIDACTKEIVGWSVDDNMRTPLIIDALRHALRRRGGWLKDRVVFHSDRGGQYVSDDMDEFCRANRIRQSMGRRATCFDNAAAESFFATIKRELISCSVWTDLRVLRFGVFEWIEGWYNLRRRHTTIGCIAPAESFRRHMALAA